MWVSEQVASSTTTGWFRDALNKQRNERNDQHWVRITRKEAFRNTLAYELARLIFNNHELWFFSLFIGWLTNWVDKENNQKPFSTETTTYLQKDSQISGRRRDLVQHELLWEVSVTLGPSHKQHGHWVNLNALLFHFFSVVWSWGFSNWGSGGGSSGWTGWELLP